MVRFSKTLGDESDETTLFEHASKFGNVKNIQIFPGINYGMICFENEEGVENLINS